MKLNLMAWRTLSRNKRRTFITSFSIAFGIFLAVTFTGSGDYSYTNMINTSAIMGFGHITVAEQGYNERPSLSRWLSDTDLVEEKVGNLPGLEGSYPRIMGQGMFAAGAKSVGGAFMALDPKKETSAHNFFLRSIVKGEMFDDKDGRGAVIGVGMAEKLNLRLGKKLIVTVTDKDGELTSELLRISGLFKTGDRAADSSIVLAPLGRMQKVLNYGEDGVSFVALYVDDLHSVKAVQKELAGSLTGSKDIEILSWRKTQPDLSGLIAVDRLFNYLMQLLVGLVIAAGIMNTMQMSVLERTREFGIMMAVGMAPGQVVRLVLVESFWLGGLGIIMGIVISTPWFIYMSSTGIDLSGLVGDDYSAGGVLVDPVLKLRLFKESAFFILLAVFLLTIAASVYPAIRAGRIMPVDTIKEI
jgi:ABC-type lipoprotein release transport system permease subunit